MSLDRDARTFGLFVPDFLPRPLCCSMEEGRVCVLVGIITTLLIDRSIVNSPVSNSGCNQLSWYAAKVHYNRTLPIREQLIADKQDFYVPEVVPSLVFVRCTDEYLARFEQKNFDRLWIYRDLANKKPAAVPDREMEVFIFVCSAGRQGLTYLGDDKPEYHQGDKVRVIDGPFKGAEGYIKRIKKDRRLVVSIKGVAAVATSFIHPQFLEKV